MRIVVKICGLRTVETVAAAVAHGAQAVGFVLAPSPRRVTAEQAAELASGLADSVLRVAVFASLEQPELDAVLEVFRPDCLQADATSFAGLVLPSDIAVWPVYREGGSPPHGGRFVYEGARSGSGRPVDWKRAARLARTGQMILAGGLHAGNVGAAISRVRPWGVDVSSGVEQEPGVKDTALIDEFIGAVRSTNYE